METKRQLSDRLRKNIVFLEAELLDTKEKLAETNKELQRRMTVIEQAELTQRLHEAQTRCEQMQQAARCMAWRCRYDESEAGKYAAQLLGYAYRSKT